MVATSLPPYEAIQRNAKGACNIFFPTAYTDKLKSKSKSLMTAFSVQAKEEFQRILNPKGKKKKTSLNQAAQVSSVNTWILLFM